MTTQYCSIIIKPSQNPLTLEIEPNVTIGEIQESLKRNGYIQPNIQWWTCYSTKRLNYLLKDQEFGQIQNDTLIFELGYQLQLQNNGFIELQLDIDFGQQKKIVYIEIDQSLNLNDVSDWALYFFQIEKYKQHLRTEIKIKGQGFNRSTTRIRTLDQLCLKKGYRVEVKIELIRIMQFNVTVLDDNNLSQFQLVLNAGCTISDLANKILEKYNQKIRSQQNYIVDIMIRNEHYNDQKKREKIIFFENFKYNQEVYAIVQRQINNDNVKIIDSNFQTCQIHSNQALKYICIHNHSCNQRKLCYLCVEQSHKDIQLDKIISLQDLVNSFEQQVSQLDSIKCLKEFVINNFQTIQETLKAKQEQFIQILSQQEDDLKAMRMKFDNTLSSYLQSNLSYNLEEMIEILSRSSSRCQINSKIDWDVAYSIKDLTTTIINDVNKCKKQYFNSSNEISQKIFQQEDFKDYINFQIQIIDENKESSFSISLSKSSSLQNLIDEIYACYKLSQTQASIDIFIDNQSYQQQFRREFSFEVLQFQKQVILQAQIRWIGG